MSYQPRPVPRPFRRSIRLTALTVCVLAMFLPAAPLAAQFPAGTAQTFSVGGVNVPFEAPNWSLDGACTTGLVNTSLTGRGWNGLPLVIRRGGTGTRMIRDLNPGPGSSTIGEMRRIGNDAITRLFFSADDHTNTNGMELYRAYQVLYPATLLEVDINPGPTGASPADFFRMSSNSGHMLFSADDGTNGRELWKAQTGANFFTMQIALIKDINPGPEGSNPSGFSNAGDVVVFAANGPDELNNPAGRELWKTDGVLGGANTGLLIDINQTPDNSASSNPEQLTQIVIPGESGTVTVTCFTADDGVNGRELWRTDGTLAGTGMLKDIIPGATGSNPTNLISGAGTLNNTLFFTVDSDGVNGMELWKSNGALDGSDTVMVKDIGGNPGHFRAVGPLNLVFFILGNQLWKTDGTEAGTVVVQSFTSISGPMATTGGILYFAADDGSGSGVELWQSDGTTSSLVRDINPGPASSDPANLASIAGRIYFSADDGTHGRELWRTDSNDGAVMILDINPGPASSNPANFNEFDGTAVFTADDGTHGTELWQTDGFAEPQIKGISHKWDLAAVINDLDPGKNAVAGADSSPFVIGCNIIDGPTSGGGDNRLESKQAIHQLNILVEITDGVDRAPVIITNADCGDGSGFARPVASLSGDGQPHNAIAAGMLAIMDQNPCDTSPIGPQSPMVPLMEVPVIYDGLNWRPMSLAEFPDMLQSAPGTEVNTLNQLSSTTLPPGLVQATHDPWGTKRFNTLKIFVKSDSIQVLWHKRQGGNDGLPSDTNWVVTLPRQYMGAFRAVHVGTPNCTPSPYEFYFDVLAITGGIFTDSLEPFGACCAPGGCTEVTSAAECTGGTFAAWQSCADIRCCPIPWADADRDGDVDLDDFGRFQRCFTGTPGGVPPGCECVNQVQDTTIDTSDFDEFKKCVTGPAIPFVVGNPPAGCTICAPPPAICSP